MLSGAYCDNTRSKMENKAKIHVDTPVPQRRAVVSPALFARYLEFQHGGEFNMLELPARHPSLFSEVHMEYVMKHYTQLLERHNDARAR